MHSETLLTGLVTDEQGQQVGTIHVDQSPQVFAKLNTFLQQFIGTQPKEHMACIIETTHGLLIAALLEADTPVDRQRSASGAKADTIDAYLVAKAGRADCADLCRLTPDNEQVAELKTPTRDQDGLGQMLTRLVNQLTACRVTYYAVVALEFFATMQLHTTLIFLQTCPTPQAAMAASVEQIVAVLRQARHANPSAFL